ncbi:helix-turn-helix domain-containing protein [Oryzibacter oryziterrae]|uniref:helix-turn-helix domain-containing protein n=1 Tax=Oryzibacter oryziterrae TaxID=2766474 RepID=UPI001F46C3F3|nr:XRE family transcriptional regulator [Oryzibacter oryziterrae]
MSTANTAVHDGVRPCVGALMRERRRQLQMTLQDVCAAAGISVGYLSQVERDQATPSLGTLAQIARCLGVGIDYFVSAPAAEDLLSKGTDRRRFAVDGSPVQYERLASDFAGNTLSSFIIHIPPGYASETVSHEGEEIVYVLEGRLIHSLDGEEMKMETGDCLHFRGSRPHAWRNDSDKVTTLLWTGTLPLFRP